MIGGNGAPVLEGKPCRKAGHTLRYRHGGCVQCLLAASASRYSDPATRARKIAQGRTEERRAYQAAYHATHKTEARDRQRLAYGSRHEEIRSYQRAYYAKRKEAVAKRPPPENCEACGDATPGRGRLGMHFDHNHATGEFRGWLCPMCNRALGCARDDVKRLRSLIDYLERNK